MKIKVNGIELYYEKIGQGKPLIFLHGNGEDHFIFDGLSKPLSELYTIYLIDSRGHGKSSKENEFHYDHMTEDIHQFIMNLQIDKPVLFGFSDGAIIGLLLSIKYPNLLSKLIIAGANIYPQGLKYSTRLEIKKAYKNTDNPLLKLMIFEPNIKKKELNLIIVPTLILAGQFDDIKKSHTKLIQHNIDKSRLLIMQGHNHNSYITHQNILVKPLIDFIT